MTQSMILALRTGGDIVRAFLMLLAVSFLAGCTTTPLKFSESKLAPADQIIDAGSGDAIVLIKRDAGTFAWGVDTSIFINGKLRARLARSEMVTLRSAPGRTIIGVAIRDDGAELREIETNLIPGQNRYRIFFDTSLYISPTAPD